MTNGGSMNFVVALNDQLLRRRQLGLAQRSRGNQKYSLQQPKTLMKVQRFEKQW